MAIVPNEHIIIVFPLIDVFVDVIPGGVFAILFLLEHAYKFNVRGYLVDCVCIVFDSDILFCLCFIYI